MNEKIYKTMASSGAGSLALGIGRSGDGACHRNSDDRKRCETAQKKIRHIDIKR